MDFSSTSDHSWKSHENLSIPFLDDDSRTTYVHYVPENKDQRLKEKQQLEKEQQQQR